MGPDALGEQVHERFAANPKLHAIPIVREDGVPIGLVNRYRFLEAISRRYGHDLLGRRPATQFMEPSPLIVDQHMSLGDLSHIIVEDSAALHLRRVHHHAPRHSTRGWAPATA